MDDEDANDGDYQVGYAKPPKQHQFRKGQSGNPLGRPKGVRNMSTMAAEVFGELVRLRRDGSWVEVPMAEAILRSMATKAAKGDVGAFRALQPLLAAAGLTVEDIEDAPMSAEDEALLTRFLARTEGDR